MELSHTLLRDFAAITNDEKAAPGKEKTIYGTIVEQSGAVYVQLDGSDILTPAITVVEAKNGDRVTVIIKDHTAIVTGNLSAPAITRVGDTYTRMTEAGVVVGRFDEDDVPEDAYTLVAPDGFYVMASSTRTAAYFGSSIKLYKPGTNQAVVDITSSGAKFVGRVETTAGTIGGWDITTDGIMYTSSNFRVGMLPGTNSSGTYLFVRDDRGSESTYPFVVRSDGSVVMSTGHIGLGTKKIEIGADATDAYLYYGMTSLSDTTHDGFFVGTTGIALGKGAFKVTAAGALTAKSANVTGTINATAGTFGASDAAKKITIGTNKSNASIYYGMSSLGNTSSDGFYIGTDGIALGKGAFKVTAAGVLTATSGKIAEWSIDSDGITYTSSGQFRVGVLPGTNSSGTFLFVREYTGSTSTYPFIVRSDGSVTMTKATITGVITAKNADNNRKTVIDSDGIRVKNSDENDVFTVVYRRDPGGAGASPRVGASMAIGYNSSVSGCTSLALGDRITITANRSVGVGEDISIPESAYNANIAAFGSDHNVSGNDSFAANNGNQVTGSCSAAFGFQNIVNSNWQFVIGQYNKADNDSKYAFIVGNGEAYNARSNAFTIDWGGNGIFSGVVKQSKPVITLTRTTNSYVDATYFANMRATQVGNLIVIYGNLRLTASLPVATSDDLIQIGTVGCSENIMQGATVMVPSSNGQPVLIYIGTDKTISLYNYGSSPATGWIRFSATIVIYN